MYHFPFLLIPIYSSLITVFVFLARINKSILHILLSSWFYFDNPKLFGKILASIYIHTTINTCYQPFFNRTIMSKDETTPPNFVNVFQLVIKDYNLMFYYRPATGNASVATYNLLQSQSEKLQQNEWHLITVAVIDKALSYYIDGELMNANFVTLSDYINNSAGGFRIGQKYGGQ